MSTRRLIRIDPEAEEELLSAHDWYEARRRGLGNQFTDAIDEATERVLAIPGASTPVPGVPADLPVRRVFVKRFPYTVVFIEMEDLIFVLAYPHLKRQPRYWLHRIPT